MAVLRAYLEKRPDEAMELLTRYDKPNQDLLLCLVPLVVRLTEGSLRQADPHELAVMVEQLQSLLVPLRARAALAVDRLHFCRQTERGWEPWEAGHAFRPGEVVWLYLRPHNYSVTPGGDNALMTVARVPLSCTLTIRAVDGRRVGWQQ